MMRTLPDGRQKFCYGLFTLALVVSGILGLLLSYWLDASLSDQMTLWMSAAVGGNLGPLIVDLTRRVVHF